MKKGKRLSRLLAPSMRLYFAFLVIFVAASFFFSLWLGLGEAAVVAGLFAYSRLSARRRRARLLDYIETVTYNVDSATKDTLLNFPLPMVIFRLEDSEIIWSNENFLHMTAEREHVFEIKLTDIVPGFSAKWLAEGKSECPDLAELYGRKYRLFGNLVRSEQDAGQELMGTVYWLDVTEYANIRSEYIKTRPVVALLLLDNYDELLKNMTDTAKSGLLAAIDGKISDWVGGSGGMLCKYDRDRYLFVFEEQYLAGFTEGKFALLDSVRAIVNPGGVAATMSIGVGRDAPSLDEAFRYASLGIEMALSRGGDQAVIKNKLNFEFYGGFSTELERRTKVKSRVMASAVGECIADASNILIMGHRFADLDTVGAGVGLCCIARKRGKQARIVLRQEESPALVLVERMKRHAEYEDVFIDPQEAMLAADGKTLLIVVDTNRPEQVESQELLMSCNRVAVIDHHRRAATYIDNAVINFHEPYASSACELVAELMQYLVERADILRAEAEAVLSGIVMDTKSFTLRTGSRTFDAAAFLRRAGSDTTEVKRLLQNDLPSTVARYEIIRNAKEYKPGIVVASAPTQEDRIVAAQASDELLNIAGIQASFVVYNGGDTVNISARSIGDVNVQMVLEKLGGGGNKSTAGAQIAGESQDEVLKRLLAAIDAYLTAGKTH